MGELQEKVQFIEQEDIVDLTGNIPGVKLKSFFQEGDKEQPLVIYDSFESFLKLVLTAGDAIQISKKKLFVPVSRGTQVSKEFLPLIGEKIINLKTMEGKQEAAERLAILAYLLWKNPKRMSAKVGLNSLGCANIIGYFKFPNGSENLAIAFFNDDQGGSNKAWWLNVIDAKETAFHMESSVWFSFDETLPLRLK